MPLVRIEMRSGKPLAYKKAVLDSVHEALVQAISIPDHDRNQRLYELDAEHFEISPNKSQDAIIIEIVMFRGRSPEAKKRLFQTIVANLEKRPGVDGKDIIIVLHEPPLENWGIRGGKPASEVDLGFNINV